MNVLLTTMFLHKTLLGKNVVLETWAEILTVSHIAGFLNQL